MRLTGVSVSNAMEASMGAIWGKDPRYRRSKSESFKGRIGQVVKRTFLAANRPGRLAPAFARYISISGSNFISIAGQRGYGGKCIFPYVARLCRTDEQQRLSGVLAGCSPSIFAPRIGRESIADHEKPADLELSARLMNILQRAVKSRPLIRFQGRMACAPSWN